MTKYSLILKSSQKEKLFFENVNKSLALFEKLFSRRFEILETLPDLRRIPVIFFKFQKIRKILKQ